MSPMTPFEFSEKLRLACELFSQLVWHSHRVGLANDGEWPEENLFSALVNQGFRGEDPRASSILQMLDSPGPLRISFGSVRHNQQAMEPITGADLGVVVSIKINQKEISRRGFLVQLKKAVLLGDPPRITFRELHHLSGEKYFKRRLHQGQRMSLFTNSAVYWIAVPPDADQDTGFFSRFMEATSLAAKRRNRENYSSAAQCNSQTISPGLPLRYIYQYLDPDELDYFIHYFGLRFGRPSGLTSKDYYDMLLVAEADQLFRDLRVNAASSSLRAYGTRSILPVLAIHADSIVGLYRSSATEWLGDLFPFSVSLTDFILGDVIADGFGDGDPQFVDAIMQNRPNDYIMQLVSLERARDIGPDARLARETLEVSLSVQVGAGDRPADNIAP